jgi:hypothetical protein
MYRLRCATRSEETKQKVEKRFSCLQLDGKYEFASLERKLFVVNRARRGSASAMTTASGQT